MKKFSKYINTMYRPARRILNLGLGVFALSLTILAVSLRGELIAGARGVIHIYPQMIEQIIFPLPLLLFVVFIVDFDQRKKKD